MLSQALNRAMPNSRNQLEGVDRKKLIFYLAVQLYCTLALHLTSASTLPGENRTNEILHFIQGRNVGPSREHKHADGFSIR